MIATQSDVWAWCRLTVGERRAFDRTERAKRLLEEAIELAQAEGVTEAQAQAWVSRVYSRPVGDPMQEVGGIGVCLLAWAGAANIDLFYLINAEFARVNQPVMIEKIRARQEEKDKTENELLRKKV